MTPQQLIANVTALVQPVLPGLGTLGAVLGTALYAGGKATDSPGVVAWGKKAWFGAIVAFGGATIIGLLQYIAGRIFGG
jgi:hypothetical protein